MTIVTPEDRQRIPRPVWMTARARNALRRPVFIAAVSLATGIVALAAMIVLPLRSVRPAGVRAPKPAEWPDTLPLIAVADTAQVRLAAATAALDTARTRAVTLARSLAVVTLDSAAANRRDSLRVAIAAINALLARAENAPLPASYRAIAESPSIAADPRLHALLDTLGEIEKERESSGTGGGADPVFVALTARATEIGRGIQAVAGDRRDDMQNVLASLAPAAPPASGAELAAADTLAHVARRDTMQMAYDVAAAQLARARQQAAVLQQRADRARAADTNTAPPIALLLAALVCGGVLGFGVALILEIRRPRIADEHEAEWAADARVLSVVTPRPPPPERARRLADRAAPPFIDPAADSHQLIYLNIVTAGAGLLMLTVTGAEPTVVAVIAANFAAIAAEEARNVLVIDVDAAGAAVAPALRLRPRPGVADIIRNAADWPEATVQATVGRDRTIDVVPAGQTAAPPDASEVIALLRRDAARLARHYDAIIVVASIQQSLAGVPGALPITDTIYCARVAHTGLADLHRAMQGLRAAGAIPRGVVLWNAPPPPVLPSSASPSMRDGPRPRPTPSVPVAGALH